jgi:hypothetical protein
MSYPPFPPLNRKGPAVPGRGGNEEGTPQAGATFDTMAHDACIAYSAIAAGAPRLEQLLSNCRKIGKA